MPRRARAWVAGMAGMMLAAAALATSAPAQTTTLSRTTTTTTAKADKVLLRSQLGIIYAQNGQVDEARKEFVKLLEEPTGRAAALTTLGNLGMLDGDVDVALENYTQAAALDTADGGILLNLGIAYNQAGKDDAAADAIARALTKTGGPERAQYLLGIRSDSDTSKGQGEQAVQRGDQGHARQGEGPGSRGGRHDGAGAEVGIDAGRVASRRRTRGRRVGRRHVALLEGEVGAALLATRP